LFSFIRRALELQAAENSKKFDVRISSSLGKSPSFGLDFPGVVDVRF
jgi:hypothetical protein